MSYNSSKIFFLFILIFSTFVVISSNSWLGCWMGLEMNLLSFIPLISNSNNLLSTEASLKYFLTQSIASINFLFFILMIMIFKNFLMNHFLLILTNFTLLMKMGSVPFHFWFPNMVEGLSWFNNFILMTWQKISPMILMSYYFNLNLMILTILMNTIIGALGGIKQTSLRKLMAFSSINNLGWMMTAIMISENLWFFYMLIYMFMMSIMCFLFNMMNIFFINQFFITNMNSIIKINLMINFLSLGGLPPFLGFFPKWIIINLLMNNNLIFMIFIMIMMSLIILFFYIRIIYSSIMFNYFKLKWFNYNFNNKMFLINIFSFLSIFLMIICSFFFY
uniref:NADH-ubiquinone oxidoreductase chain 2 n=1 Tax=Somena scintillans TaxID=1706520 RepID=A0A385NH62_9NEOP|nr:NADH dehydrogenase subunit 2 [Somena scintillans]AYA73180.1 NADH dehydrogenase subunit 2 [Somena scintillans]